MNEKQIKTASLVAVIAGATGAVGRHLVKLLLANQAYKKVIVLTRRPLALQDNKLEQRMVNFDDVLAQSTDCINEKVDHFYCCLGTTIKVAGSKAAFTNIDMYLTTELARQAHLHGASFCGLISAMGANSNASFFYNQVKGKTEQCFREIGFNSLTFFRPSLLKATRENIRFGEDIGNLLMKVLNPILPRNYRAIDVSKVAVAMLESALVAKPGLHVVLSGDMQ